MSHAITKLRNNFRIARGILTEMADADAREDYESAEIVCDGGECYLGVRRIHYGQIMRLLGLLAISDRSDSETVRRYCVNDTGRAIVRRIEIIPEIIAAVSQKRAFTIRDDRIVELEA